jgi:succinate dehydrogenase / fumarate reductase cytochrome b subunit
VTRLLRSAIVQKAVMAVSGLVLFGFVLGHLAGNLKLYQGPEKLNAYAEWLREMGAPAVPHGAVLWVARGLLLGAVVLHIAAAWRLTVASRQARPIPYARHEFVRSSYAARTMRWGGVIVLLFVLYHLAHFTFGFRWAHPDFVPGDVYHNVVAGFRVPWVAAVYVVAQVALGLHLRHGLWSLFQSLGWNHPRWNSWRDRLAAGFALAIVAGNVSFPVAVLTGWVG